MRTAEPAGGDAFYYRPMLAPAPTSKVDPRLARGTYIGHETPPAPKKPYVRLGFANTQYDLHLLPAGTLE